MSPQSQSNPTFEQFLQQARSQSCTDLHLCPGQIPHWRIQGELQSTDYPPISESLFWEWMQAVLDSNGLERFQEGNTINQVVQYADSILSIHGHWTATGPAIALRLPIATIPDMAKLGLPELLNPVMQGSTGGLIAVAGMTGSGKSTSLVSLVNHINATTCRHIVTLEDPLWFVYPQQQSTITQWVAGIHIESLVDGVVQAQRIDADVIVINEISDRPTLDQALQAANSGCLVMACFHADRAIDLLDAIFSFYSETEQSLIRYRLAKVLKAILGQRLVPTLTGTFRRAALYDLLMVTPEVQTQLAQGHTDYLASMMDENAEIWPRTMTQDLQRLQEEGRISQETVATVSQALQQHQLQPF